jgi:DNA-directed RNA polymerase specialized sigma24 family protein
VTSDEYEAALRSLPEAHSLALRLVDAGVDDDVICDYLHIEPEALPTLLDLARRKLDAVLSKPLP